MRGPIHFALHWPDRSPSDLVGFDLSLFRQLTFEAVDPARYPSLELGYRCVDSGGDAGCVLNAADEIAVQAFLERRIAFPEITRVSRSVLERRPALSGSIDELLRADSLARDLARAEVARAEAVPATRPF
jgi:1-deoxy-D-xylulose-5-phosphate reductoisomerase